MSAINRAADAISQPPGRAEFAYELATGCIDVRMIGVGIA
jgi:hypothetical protein